jgi:hypothetical protein
VIELILNEAQLVVKFGSNQLRQFSKNRYHVSFILGEFMGYKMLIIEKNGYLHFKISGRNSPETVMHYMTEIFNECLKRNCSSILIEENLMGPSVSMADVFKIVSQGSKQTWPHVKQIAYVDMNTEHSSTLMKFAETAAVNRGVNVRVFSDLSRAEKWISEFGVNLSD